MKNIYTPADIARITEATIGNLDEILGLEGRQREAAMARRAAFVDDVGRAVASEVMALRAGSDAEVLIFAGDGICGAYALAAAQVLSAEGCQAKVTLFNIGGNLLTADTVAARDRYIAACGDSCLNEVVNPGSDFTMPHMNSRTFVVDGIFGSEYGRPLRGGYQAVARYINEHNARVVAIDVPSGMSTDLAVGMVNRNIIHAELTLTLVGPTLSFFMPENAELVGKWKTLPVAFNEEAMMNTECSCRLVDTPAIRNALPKRSRVMSKADLGDALIFAGSYGMLGAAVLATRAATRSGCGKVTCHAPRCGFYVLQTSVPSAMFATDGSDYDIRYFEDEHDAAGVAIGPGIGRSEGTSNGLDTYLKDCFASQKPLVLDADALNIIAERPYLLDFIPVRSVITPHAGEFDRLFGQQASHSTRTLMAIEMAKRYSIAIVLKGPWTFTIWVDGSIFVNSSGTEALATAGAGDVLTGLLAGLIAQKMAPEVAAVAAVYIHGIAGRIAARQCGIAGTTAEDVADAIGPAIDSILNSKPDAHRNKGL